MISQGHNNWAICRRLLELRNTIKPIWFLQKPIKNERNLSNVKSRQVGAESQLKEAAWSAKGKRGKSRRVWIFIIRVQILTQIRTISILPDSVLSNQKRLLQKALYAQPLKPIFTVIFKIRPQRLKMSKIWRQLNLWPVIRKASNRFRIVPLGCECTSLGKGLKRWETRKVSLQRAKCWILSNYKDILRGL